MGTKLNYHIRIPHHIISLKQNRIHVNHVKTLIRLPFAS
uniref:Uncharacterized protein n=1 Tax=Rhizophora mucronata TaxID=61149 RepID=A0A2P2QNG1_RHIMU